MLFSVCKKCGTVVNENQIMYDLSIDEGNGNISHIDVCQKCYFSINANTDECKLLVENM